MKKHLIHFLLMAVLSVFSVTAFAQTTVKGQLVDAETGEPLIGASVVVEGTTQGSVTDIDGNFTQNVAPNATLVFKYVGYKDQQTKITQKGASVNLGIIQMQPDAVMLNDVTITSSIAVTRKTPIAVSTLEPAFIEETLSTKEFPELLKQTPGVYATKSNGAYGESEIYMRGFDQTNVAVMVNGVPVNDMENGRVYWSNWAGLSDVTRYMQSQRGLGASKVCAPSVGGSVNIITRTTDSKLGGSVSYGIGNDGYNKLGFSASTGLTKDGWAFSVVGSRTWGDGYVQGAEFDAYSWFVNVSKRFNDKHTLAFTAMGAPQTHNKRYDALSIKEWQKVGYKYNAAYGFKKNGEMLTGTSYNYYHKPQFSLNHQWDINHKSSLSTALYMSVGKGGGYGSQSQSGANSQALYGARYGVPLTTYRNPDGSFDYGAVEMENAESENGSLYILSTSTNDHMWYGMLSTFSTNLTKDLNLQAGLDLRSYKGIHTGKIVDLLGGDYFLDSYNRSKVAHKAAAGTHDFIYEKLKKGDIVNRDYDGHNNQLGAFGQLEYSKDAWTAFVSANVNHNTMWRKDRFYYDNEKSDKIRKLGGGVKGGVNYNINEHHNVFANVGFYSRTPSFSSAFLSYNTSNDVNKDCKNEKVLSYELGYGFVSPFFKANINLYRTSWLDKAMNKYDANADGYINMTGVDALHQGIEVEFVATPLRNLNITGMFSWGDWKWTGNNVKGYLFDKYGQPISTTGENVEAGSEKHAWASLNMKDVHVGGSAQTTAALGLNYEFLKGLRFGMNMNWYHRFYSYYAISISKLNAENDIAEPWRVPSWTTFDARVSYNFKIGNLNATWIANCDNLFNARYITSATDNGANTKGNHTWEDATVFYGFGRTWSTSLRVKF